VLVLIVGLVLFLGVHSTSVFAFDWRNRMIARIGLQPWKGLYSLASLIGFLILLYGYSLARREPVVIWSPPVWTYHVNALLTVIGFVLFTAAYVPHNAFKARFHHPMLLGVKCWAVGHLIANGTLHDIVLFGAFLAWAVLAFIKDRRRDRTLGTRYAAGTASGTAITVVIGVVAAVVFALYLHGLLIGVRPFG
jgi:uncharacterized membrane protein